MDVVGEKFKTGETFYSSCFNGRKVDEGRHGAFASLIWYPAGAVAKGTVVLGTVKGDLHDIGKNLVKMMMEGKGLNVIDLGVDTSAEKFVSSALEHNASIIGVFRTFDDDNAGNEKKSSNL